MPSVSAAKSKKQRTISIKTITAQIAWQLETAEDVKRYVPELERKLLEQLEKGTILHIEF